MELKQRSKQVDYQNFLKLCKNYSMIEVCEDVSNLLTEFIQKIIFFYSLSFGLNFLVK